jgi:signal transduction histidine kinase
MKHVGRALEALVEHPTACRHQPWFGYIVAVVIPTAMMLIGARVGLPAFMFEQLTILLVVGLAVLWGMGPAVLAAFTAALGDNIILRDPIGRPTITGIRDVLDLTLFIVVAVTVGWLVAKARRDRCRAELSADRERQAREERDRLVAMVSHDLATPLAVIRGTIQRARVSGQAAEVDMDRVWGRLDTAASRATSLIRTLGDAQTLDSGELTLELRREDVRNLITPVVKMMDRISERHPVLVRLPGEPAMVECDSERVQRVFENLLSNAIKYSPDGGPIEIEVTCNKSNAVVNVQDFGIGISPDALPHVFDRGYRAREAVATAPGLGLGLNIASEIVRRHGGSIEARMGRPRGSILTVRLPLVQQRECVSPVAHKLGASSEVSTTTRPQVSDQVVSPAARACGVRKSGV